MFALMIILILMVLRFLQLRDQTWIMRNRLKRFAIPVVSASYGLHPSEHEYLLGFKNVQSKQKEKQKVAYVEQRYLELTGRLSPFLYGSTGDGVFVIIVMFSLRAHPLQEPVAFGHPAVVELIANLVFSSKHSKIPIASLDLNAFDPIPISLIAYASAGVSARSRWLTFANPIFFPASIWH